MSNVFLEEIKDGTTWGQVFQSLPAFEKLIAKICEKEGLTCNQISHLTPGTNAVFKVDDRVVKVFAPVESGLDTEIDYNCELFGMNRAVSLGRYQLLFAYSIVMDFYKYEAESEEQDFILEEHLSHWWIDPLQRMWKHLLWSEWSLEIGKLTKL